MGIQGELHPQNPSLTDSFAPATLSKKVLTLPVFFSLE